MAFGWGRECRIRNSRAMHDSGVLGNMDKCHLSAEYCAAKEQVFLVGLE
jgi:hypothetical protein